MAYLKATAVKCNKLLASGQKRFRQSQRFRLHTSARRWATRTVPCRAQDHLHGAHAMHHLSDSFPSLTLGKTHGYTQSLYS